jgi:hypothetical protein
MDMNANAFYAFWNAEPLEQNQATKKLFYRVIGGYKFQFRVLDYRARTQLGLRVAGLAKHLEPLFKVAQQFEPVGEELSDAQNALATANNEAVMLRVLPDLLGFIGQPEIHTLMEEFVRTAQVDRGKGSFESLADMPVADDVFGEDITLQLPVAATAMEVNLAGFSQRVMSAFNSLPFGTR